MGEEKPLAFVIMPFDSALDAVYTELIKSTLEEAGYLVQRADDLVTSKNILDDIVGKIASADIVVADLTDLNPNVFYELGIAHSINGRVLMITQDVTSLPFDLQSYRVVEYDTHFSRFTEAKSRLADYAAAAIQNELPFGSPVSDYAKAVPDSSVPQAEEHDFEDSSSADNDEGEPGFLDHLLQTMEAGAVLTQAVEEITVATELVGIQIDEGTAQLQKAVDIDDPVRQVRASHAAVRQVGLHLNEYARFLEDKNTQYESALATFGTSFEGTLSAPQPDDGDALAQLQSQLESITSWETSLQESRESMAGFIETIETTPRVEKYSSKAMSNAQRQLERLNGNLEQTEATLSRVRRMISKLLADDS